MSLGLNLGTNIPFEVLEGNFLNNLKDYYRNPAKYYMEPFQIFGNLYYVGDKKVCSHLIDTGDGLILFDSGYAHTTHLLIHSIEALGFSPADVKWIIHSHGHFDHFGAGHKLKDLYGCELLLSKVDADRLRSDPETALMEYSPEPWGPILQPDRLIEDGDVLTLGNTSIRCISAPGHTEGTMAFFFQAADGVRTKQVGYIGGIGFLTLYKAYLEKYHLPMDMQEQMLHTVKKLRSERADITLGNHPNHNGTIEKRQYMIDHPGENPFCDDTVWVELLDAIDTRMADFQVRGY